MQGRSGESFALRCTSGEAVKFVSTETSEVFDKAKGISFIKSEVFDKAEGVPFIKSEVFVLRTKVIFFRGASQSKQKCLLALAERLCETLPTPLPPLCKGSWVGSPTRRDCPRTG